jgi:hypothetical protein
MNDFDFPEPEPQIKIEEDWTFGNEDTGESGSFRDRP